MQLLRKNPGSNSRYRISPLILVLIAVFVVGAVVAGLSVWKASTPTASPTPTTQPSQPTVSPSRASAPAPTTSTPSSQAVRCPAPVRLFEGNYVTGQDYAIDSPYMKDRAFDFLEANLIEHPQKLLKTMRTKGDPAGLLTKEALARLEADVAAAPPDSEIPGGDVTLVLNRQASSEFFDPVLEESNGNVRTIVLRAVFDRCRNGYLIDNQNGPAVNTDAEGIRTVWIFEEGAWRVTV